MEISAQILALASYKSDITLPNDALTSLSCRGRAFTGADRFAPEVDLAAKRFREGRVKINGRERVGYLKSMAVYALSRRSSF